MYEIVDRSFPQWCGLHIQAFFEQLASGNVHVLQCRLLCLIDAFNASIEGFWSRCLRHWLIVPPTNMLCTSFDFSCRRLIVMDFMGSWKMLLMWLWLMLPVHPQPSIRRGFYFHFRALVLPVICQL